MIPLAIASMALSSIPLVSNTKSAVAKYAIPVLAITAVGGVAYVGYKYLKQNELPELRTNPSFPASKLTDVQAQAIAERLYVAMKSVGTDEAMIRTALTNLSENDFVKVYKAFGKRQYSLTWGNMGDPLTSSKHHLITWLQNELSSSDLKEIQKIVPNLLTVSV